MGKLIKSLSLTLLVVGGLSFAGQDRAWGQVNPNASPNVKNIYAWIKSLRDRETEKVIVGQEIRNVPDITSYTTHIAELQRQTGRWVSLIGHEYNGHDAYDGNGDFTARQDLINYWNAGGLVTVNWNFPTPFVAGGGYGDTSQVNLSALVPNAQGQRLPAWQQQLDNTAAELTKYRDAGVVVLWRPFQEMNADWFWWGEVPSNPTGFQAVWRDMYNYFTNVKGLNNLLWVYAPIANGDPNYAGYADFYPGSDYVDIVGPDVYSDSPGKSDYFWVGNYGWFVSTGKPIFFNEFGRQFTQGQAYTNDYDLRRLITGLQTNYREVVGVQYWSGWNEGSQRVRMPIIENLNPIPLLNDPYILTRDETQNYALIDTPKNYVINGGFEYGSATNPTAVDQQPIRWSKYEGSGYNIDAFFAQQSSYADSGSWVGAHWLASDFKAMTYQWVSELDDGSQYKLSIRTKRSSAFNSCYAEVLIYRSTGTERLSVNIPYTQSWTTVSIPNIKPASGGVQVNIVSDGQANNWLNFDNVKLEKQ
jgi:mannan endo-1,4-beta-mannosidase